MPEFGKWMSSLEFISNRCQLIAYHVNETQDNIEIKRVHTGVRVENDNHNNTTIIERQQPGVSDKSAFLKLK